MQSITIELSKSFVTFWNNFATPSLPLAIVDILLVTFFLYWLYSLVRDTKAIYIIYGISFLAAVFMISNAVGLLALSWLTRQIFAVLLIAIPVIFQPELRRALERLGRTRISEIRPRGKKGEFDERIPIIVKGCQFLANKKIGALIVIKRRDDIFEYIKQGKLIDARLSTELLINIFFPGSPLHDGAVIIDGNRIVAASVTLPLEEGELTYTVWTRHRAAIGLSSQVDSVVIVVSEERGSISIAEHGNLSYELSFEQLSNVLSDLLNTKRDHAA